MAVQNSTPGRVLRALVLVCVLGSVPSVRAQDTEERIRKLEEQLREVTQELVRLKSALQKEQAPSPANAAAPAPAGPPASTASSSAQTDPALRKEVDQLKGKVAEVKEQADATDAKVDNNGVRAYLGPGLVFEDPRGRWRMQVSGRAQLDYRAFTPDVADVNTFSIRRARIGVNAQILDDYYVFVEEEFANQNTNPSTSTATPILTFAYMDFLWFRPGIKFRLGQFKPPIGLDNMQLDLQTDFLERGLTQSLLGSVYDRGVMVYGEPKPGLVYSVALTNGTGQAIDEQQSNLQEAQADGKDYALRLTNDFAQTFKIPDTVIHLGGTYKRGSIDNSAQFPARATTVQTEARGLTFFIPAPFNAAGSNVSNINRTIVDIEAAFAHRQFKVQGDYVQANYSGSTISPGTPVDFDRSLKAAYITLGWFLSGEYYADIYREGTFVRPRPKNNFTRGPNGGWGLWELDLRYSWFDGTDFNNGNPVNTGRLGTTANFPNITQGTNKATAWTIGLKWQPNLYTRLAVNLIRTKFDTPVIVNGSSTDYENAITMRAQVDF